MSTLGKQWSRFDLDEAQRLYADGATCQQIADKQGLSRTYVSARLRQAMTPMRPTGRPQVVLALDSTELVRLREAGLSWRQLAVHFAITRYAARANYLRATARGR